MQLLHRSSSSGSKHHTHSPTGSVTAMFRYTSKCRPAEVSRGMRVRLLSSVGSGVGGVQVGSEREVAASSSSAWLRTRAHAALGVRCGHSAAAAPTLVRSFTHVGVSRAVATVQMRGMASHGKGELCPITLHKHYSDMMGVRVNACLPTQVHCLEVMSLAAAGLESCVHVDAVVLSHTVACRRMSAWA
jgi:hypothetical protein